jgi:hypothetical protein
LALGKTLKQLYKEIDSAELSEWEAYYNLEPWGQLKEDIRTGIIASTMANVNRGKDTKAFTYNDFVLKSKLEFEYEVKHRQKQSSKQIVSTLTSTVKKNGN